MNELKKQTMILNEQATAEMKRRVFWTLYEKAIEIEAQHGKNRVDKLAERSKEIATHVERLVSSLTKNYKATIF